MSKRNKRYKQPKINGILYFGERRSGKTKKLCDLAANELLDGKIVYFVTPLFSHRAGIKDNVWRTINAHVDPDNFKMRTALNFDLDELRGYDPERVAIFFDEIDSTADIIWRENHISWRTYTDHPSFKGATMTPSGRYDSRELYVAGQIWDHFTRVKHRTQSLDKSPSHHTSIRSGTETVGSIRGLHADYIIMDEAGDGPRIEIGTPREVQDRNISMGAVLAGERYTLPTFPIYELGRTEPVDWTPSHVSIDMEAAREAVLTPETLQAAYDRMSQRSPGLGSLFVSPNQLDALRNTLDLNPRVR